MQNNRIISKRSSIPHVWEIVDLDGIGIFIGILMGSTFKLELILLWWVLTCGEGFFFSFILKDHQESEDFPVIKDTPYFYSFRDHDTYRGPWKTNLWNTSQFSTNLKTLLPCQRPSTVSGLPGRNGLVTQENTRLYACLSGRCLYDCPWNLLHQY